MNKISYSGCRFPPEIIHRAIWLYLRFTLNLRDVEDLLSERGIAVSHEIIRRWVNHFGPLIATGLRKRRPKPHKRLRITPASRIVSYALKSSDEKWLGLFFRHLECAVGLNVYIPADDLFFM